MLTNRSIPLLSPCARLNASRNAVDSETPTANFASEALIASRDFTPAASAASFAAVHASCRQ